MDGRTDKWIKRKEGRGETKEEEREEKFFPLNVLYHSEELLKVLLRDKTMITFFLFLDISDFSTINMMIFFSSF